MKVIRKIIEINEEKCDGCGQCVPACAEGAIQIIDGKARLVAEKYCDGLGACLGECPNDAIKIVEREAEEFDEEAVSEYLKLKEQDSKEDEDKLACGCASLSNVNIFSTISPQIGEGATSSALSHWPVQIKLIPPHAPFLKNANLLVVADCAAVAYPNLHTDLLPGKVIMIGCPKFDNREEYVEKFKQIFSKNDIKSVSVVIMTVPCCSALPNIVKKGMEEAAKDYLIEQMVIDPQGRVVS